MEFHRLLAGATTALLLAATAGPAGAQTAPLRPDSAKYPAIRRLLAVQHTDSVMLQGIELALSAQSQQADTGVPEGFFDAFRARIRRDIGLFVERIVPVYDSLYTAAEVDQLTAFYQTPIGRRLLETQPQLATALGEIGRQWGMELAGQVLVELSRRPARP